MSNHPLVSVIIPTYNSELTIEICLKAVSKQTYPNIEVIVVDSHSNDNTSKITKNFATRMITTNEKLLGARYIGLKEAKGEYILLLDSDQILETTAIERAMKIRKEHDMLHLEEYSYKPKTWIQLLFQADRHLVHNFVEIHTDPLQGVLLARFYNRKILEAAFEAIPEEIMPLVVAHDHAIIYYESYRISQKIGILPNSVWHVEPTSLVGLWKKNYRYGKTTKELIKTGFYQSLLQKKVRFRKRNLSIKNLKYIIQSDFLLLLKGIAYQLGYWSA